MLLTIKKKSVCGRIATLLLAGVLFSGSAAYAADTAELPEISPQGYEETDNTENAETEFPDTGADAMLPDAETGIYTEDDVLSEEFVAQHKTFICDIMGSLLQNVYSYNDERLVELVERECKVEIRKVSVPVGAEYLPEVSTRGRTRDSSAELLMLLDSSYDDRDAGDYTVFDETENRDASLNYIQHIGNLQTVLPDGSAILYYSGEEAAEAQILLESLLTFKTGLSNHPSQQILTRTYMTEVMNRKPEKSPLNRILLFLLIVLSAVTSVLYMRCQNMDKSYQAMRAKVKQFTRQKPAHLRDIDRDEDSYRESENMDREDVAYAAGDAQQEYFPGNADTETHSPEERIQRVHHPRFADDPNAEVLETYLYEMENIFKDVLQKNNRQLNALYGEYEALYRKYQETELNFADCTAVVRKSNRRLERILSDFMKMLQNVRNRDVRKSSQQTHELPLETEEKPETGKKSDRAVEKNARENQSEAAIPESKAEVQELIKQEEDTHTHISVEASVQDLPVQKQDISVQDLPAPESEFSGQDVFAEEQKISAQDAPVQTEEVTVQDLAVGEKAEKLVQDVFAQGQKVSVQDSPAEQAKAFIQQDLPVTETEISEENLLAYPPEVPVEEKQTVSGSSTPYSLFYSSAPFRTFSGTLVMPDGNITIDKSVNYLIFTKKSEDILESYPTRQAALDPAIRRVLMPYFDFIGNGTLDIATEQVCVIQRSPQGRLKITQKGKIHLIP